MTTPTPEAICSALVRLLREDRERQGLSMSEVAVRAGLSQQMVSYVEREMRNPTLDTLLRIAAAQHIDLANLLTIAQNEVTPDNERHGVS